MQQFCTFYIDSQLFGIKVLRVQEVLRLQPLTAVPLAPSAVRGLINLRGQIVTALDLRRLLGISHERMSATDMMIVVSAGDEVISLVVDSVGDVIELGSAQYEPPPASVTGVFRELLRGVFKMNDQLLLHLDIDLALQAGAACAAHSWE